MRLVQHRGGEKCGWYCIYSVLIIIRYCYIGFAEKYEWGGTCWERRKKGQEVFFSHYS
ncbi:hypothetical protein [Gracilibacillus sp. JCM 18860]|uniref:hypothetical protein n=1 Tax=Gracilibacillus sp. JCM 18860 TaxID=1306159 RepID=UPI000B0D2870